MPKKICDFCLNESTGIFARPLRLSDGHQICKDCKSIVESYGLPVQFDLFQQLVTAQPNLRDMIMDAFLENHEPNATIAKFYPMPSVPLHDGEHCINAYPATLTVNLADIPSKEAITSIADITRQDINNIPDASETNKKMISKVAGTLYETEVALYFLSKNFINCHRLGHMVRNTDDDDHITVKTKKYTYTYSIKHADLFYMRERFFQKVNAAAHNKDKHLIYIRNDNEITITPGVYEIPRSLKPGLYKVKAVKDAGLHIRDSVGRVKDYYESEECIDLSDGGVLECTGEYELEWVGEKKK